MDGKGLLAREPRDEHHLGAVGLRQAHGLTARLVEIDEMGGRELDDGVAGEVGVANAQRAWRETPAVQAIVPNEIAEGHQSVDGAQGGTLSDARGGGNLRQIESALPG